MDDKIGYRLAQAEISLLLATLTRKVEDVDRCFDQAESLRQIATERNGSLDPVLRRDIFKLHGDISDLVKQTQAPSYDGWVSVFNADIHRRPRRW